MDTKVPKAKSKMNFLGAITTSGRNNKLIIITTIPVKKTIPNLI